MIGKNKTLLLLKVNKQNLMTERLFYILKNIYNFTIMSTAINKRKEEN